MTDRVWGAPSATGSREREQGKTLTAQTFLSHSELKMIQSKPGECSTAGIYSMLESWWQSKSSYFPTLPIATIQGERVLLHGWSWVVGFLQQVGGSRTSRRIKVAMLSSQANNRMFAHQINTEQHWHLFGIVFLDHARMKLQYLRMQWYEHFGCFGRYGIHA